MDHLKTAAGCRAGGFLVCFFFVGFGEDFVMVLFGVWGFVLVFLWWFCLGLFWCYVFEVVCWCFWCFCRVFSVVVWSFRFLDALARGEHVSCSVAIARIYFGRLILEFSEL